MSKLLKIGIVGATAWSAGRLIRILVRHPGTVLEVPVSESDPGQRVSRHHRELRGICDQPLEPMDVARLKSCDVVFSCKKAGESFGYVPELVEAGVKVIDFSGDYRLKETSTFSQWYKVAHSQTGLLAEAVYGLPELHRERIRKARLVANPGCYTTTTILALAPLARAGWPVDWSSVMVHAISGVSGAGRGASAETTFLMVDGNVRPYRVGSHQHTPEIEQELSQLLPNGQDGVTALFVPHVGPYQDGILIACYLRLVSEASLPATESVVALLEEFYRNEPFVRVYDAGELPQVRNVVGTNFCDIGAVVDPRTRSVVIMAATDNLVKGAAGQAVQNMNLMTGFAEETALL